MCLFIPFYVFPGVWKHCTESGSRNTKIYRYSEDGVVSQDSATESFDSSSFLSFFKKL